MLSRSSTLIAISVISVASSMSAALQTRANMKLHQNSPKFFTDFTSYLQLAWPMP